MSCCNHFRDFLVLSSADLTRLTLVDAAFGPAPVNKDNKNKTVLLLTVNQLSNTVVLFFAKVGRGLFVVSIFFLFFFGGGR